MNGLRRLLRFLPFLAAALGLARPAAAALEQDDAWLKGSGTASIFWGRSLADSTYGLPDLSQIGLRFGARLTPRLEFEVGYERTPYGTVRDPKSTLVQDPSTLSATRPVDFRSESFQARLLISPLKRKRRLQPYALAGFGRQRFFSQPGLRREERGAVSQGTFVFGVGLRHFLTRWVALRLEYAGESSFEQIQTNQSLNAGLSFELTQRRPPDDDHDGVVNFSDRCPGTPAGALVNEHNGCPYDLDGDGVPDGLDSCPRTPYGWKVDAEGCPADEDGDKVPDAIDACPRTIPGSTVDAKGCPSDEDGDGIPDGIDRCPGTMRGAQVDPLGSPTAGCTHDLDGDGVPAGLDKCAKTPKGAIVDASGCPLDSDGDGVYDGLDLCPDSPPGRLHDRDGCPKIRLDHEGEQPLENVAFLGGVAFYPGTQAWIDLAYEALEYWSDLRVEIAVQAEPGSPAAAERLARRRAEAIRSYLIGKGIASDRIVARAGEQLPAPAAPATTGTAAAPGGAGRATIRRLSGALTIHPPAALRPADLTPRPAPNEPSPAPDAAEPDDPKEGP